ncbi:hypothetical protein DXG03_000422 [Asterophora parasitica]|uniref:Uncharacterized protein n=1 Tax=Asterophora parasitica TaxID=117018 RepID=A0A9P7KFC4_9AGAR|nr:hypothetical protein DXG03_000422 [Asterophora parasitica]
MTVLTIMKGKQLGWVCLGSCAADVIVNAVAIFWVTRGLDSTLYSSTKSPSRGVPDRERRQTTAFVSDAVSREVAPKGTLSGNQPSFGYFPATSFAEPPRVEHNRDIESGHHRSPSTYKAIKSLTGIFRAKTNEPEGGLKITVTTEYDLEESHIELDSMQEEDERKKQQRLSEE